MATKRIEGRESFQAGTGSLYSPEKIEELEERRAEHDRLSSKPQKTFEAVLAEKTRDENEDEAPEEEAPEKGAKNPLLGLNPNQDPGLGKGKKGRAGQVIIKG